MKTKHIAQLLTVGLVGLFATAPAVWALNAETSKGPKLEDRIAKRIEMLDKRLDLSDEQSAELEGILKGKMKEIETLSQKSSNLREEVNGLIDGVLTEDQKEKMNQFKGRRSPDRRGGQPGISGGRFNGLGEGRSEMRGQGFGRRGEERPAMRGERFGRRGEERPAMQGQGYGRRGEGRHLAMGGQGFGPRSEGCSAIRGEGFGRRGEGRPATRGEGFGRRGENCPAMRGEGFGRRGEGRPAMRGEGFGRGAGILERLDKLGLTDEQKDDIKDIIKSDTKNKREAIHEILKDNQNEKS